MMKFLADENIDKIIVDRLRRDEQVIFYVPEMQPGLSDDDIITWANQEAAVIITADKDFGELIFRQKRISNGVVLLRLAGVDSERKTELVSEAIQCHQAELTGNFTVITPRSVRIRRNAHYKR
jgi:predicted nuclease of predicted toxin-antitoxin system